MLVGVALLLLASPARAQTGGYGPEPPSGQPGSPGSAGVLAAETMRDAGGSISATVCPGYTATVTVSPGTFSAPSTVEITNPGATDGATIATGIGTPGATPLCVFTVRIVDANGNKVAGPFTPPISVTVTGPGIDASLVVGELTADGTVSQLSSTNSVGSTTFTFSTDPTFGLFSSAAPTTTVVSSAGLARTGKGVGSEFTVANLLVLLGAVLIVGTRFARRRLQHP
jgi:hypothetical protein